MSPKEKAPAKTGAAKHIRQYATQIVAARARCVLGWLRFAPTAGDALLIGLATAYAALTVWRWLA